MRTERLMNCSGTHNCKLIRKEKWKKKILVKYQTAPYNHGFFPVNTYIISFFCHWYQNRSMLSAILRLCFNLATFQLQHLAIFDYITKFSLCRHFHLFSSNCNTPNILKSFYEWKLDTKAPESSKNCWLRIFVVRRCDFFTFKVIPELSSFMN